MEIINARMLHAIFNLLAYNSQFAKFVPICEVWMALTVCSSSHFSRYKNIQISNSFNHKSTPLLLFFTNSSVENWPSTPHNKVSITSNVVLKIELNLQPTTLFEFSLRNDLFILVTTLMFAIRTRSFNRATQCHAHLQFPNNILQSQICPQMFWIRSVMIIYSATTFPFFD